MSTESQTDDYQVIDNLKHEVEFRTRRMAELEAKVRDLENAVGMARQETLHAERAREAADEKARRTALLMDVEESAQVLIPRSSICPSVHLSTGRHARTHARTHTRTHARTHARRHARKGPRGCVRACVLNPAIRFVQVIARDVTWTCILELMDCSTRRVCVFVYLCVCASIRCSFTQETATTQLHAALAAALRDKERWVGRCFFCTAIHCSRHICIDHATPNFRWLVGTDT